MSCQYKLKLAENCEKKVSNSPMNLHFADGQKETQNDGWYKGYCILNERSFHDRHHYANSLNIGYGLSEIWYRVSQAAFHMGPSLAPAGHSWAPVGPQLDPTGAHLGMLLGMSVIDNWERIWEKGPIGNFSHHEI